MQNNVSLTELEKMVLNRIHFHISKNEKVGVDVIAKECFVSKAAIIKLSKKLGYSGYSEMYYISLASAKSPLKLGFSKSILNAYENNILRIHINMLMNLLGEYKEKNIYLDSLESCYSVKEYYLQKLLSFGFNVDSGCNCEEFRKNKPGIYFFFSYSGVREEIIEKVNMAIENNYKVVAFTSNKDSPLGKISHKTIEIAGVESNSEQYLPDFFTANLIILLELTLSEYSNKYLSKR